VISTLTTSSLVLLLGAALAQTTGHAELHAPGSEQATRLGPGWISSELNDYNLSIREAAGLLVFGRSTAADFGDAGIWIARREDGKWTEPRQLARGPGGRRDSDPWLSPDGRWLYFVSDRSAPGRESNRDDLDLWRAPIQDGRIGAPEHLAAASSPGEELGPEVHAGWLSFNSTRSGGPAQMSLYRVRLETLASATPEALPAPFNDGVVQGDLTLSPDGETALFWSVRGQQSEPELFAVLREGEAWGPALRLPPPFNAEGMDFTPAFSSDGQTLYWASQRTPSGHAAPTDGRADLYAIAAARLHAAIANAAEGVTGQPQSN
jgi:hypothetical protein